MDRARRGYVLIAVLAGLALCVALAGGYAATSRRSVMFARADVEARQAQYAARGAAIQAAKDLAIGLGRGRIVLDMGSNTSGPVAASTTGSTRIDGLPEFPPEMANAAGFLGILSRRMEEIRAGAQRSETGGTRAEAPPEESRTGAGPGAAEIAAPPAPVVVTGRGRMTLGNAAIDVSLESENGKVNINLARRRELRDLLMLLGHGVDSAEATLNAIEDYKVSLMSTASVERSAVSRRDPERPLGGRSLDRVEDLLNVVGMTPAMFESLVPHVTTLSEGPIDPNYASPEALAAIGIRSGSLLARVLEARRTGEPITATRMREILGPSVYNDVADRLAYTLPPLFTVRARAEKGESVGRFMMRITIGESGVPTLLESREGWM